MTKMRSDKVLSLFHIWFFGEPQVRLCLGDFLKHSAATMKRFLSVVSDIVNVSERAVHTSMMKVGIIRASFMIVLRCRWTTTKRRDRKSLNRTPPLLLRYYRRRPTHLGTGRRNLRRKIAQHRDLLQFRRRVWE
jgi:hypothetical protein